MKIVWLRRDLRAQDNTALVQACASGEAVCALYIATPHTWQQHQLAPMQADLIYRRLSALQADLSHSNIGLYYAQVDTFSQAAELVAAFAAEQQASGVHLNKEYEVNEVLRDEKLAELLSEKPIECAQFDDKCIIKPGAVINKQGEHFKVFTPFKRAYLKQMAETPFTVVKAPQMAVATEIHSQLVAEFSPQASFDYPRVSSEHYSVNTDAIIDTLRQFNQQKVEDYQDKRDFPALDATSVLSPYLAIGALSVRQCMARLMYAQPQPLSKGREVWQSELIWREFYQHLTYFEPKICKGRSFHAWGDELVWDNDQAKIDAWQQGMTGYPIVDAAMRQLNQLGWMHNRLRMIVASFLVKDLHIDWRIGERYFMSKLVDGDYAANNGGWQWCASTGCDGQPYFRIFNPITQGEKFDPEGEFIRQWVPELKSMPQAFIHQPWRAPNAKALSYPQPIVDHKVERAITLGLYKQAKDT